MAAIRQNILVSTDVRDRFLDGVVALDQERPGVTASDLASYLSNNGLPLSIRGIQQDLSTYDLFVFWHMVAMSLQLSVGNAAHSGPIFLPWHRMFLLRLEQEIQRVLGDPDFGLPYWDWAADGELPVQEQWRATLWTPDYLGESRGAVNSGKLGAFRVRLVQHPVTGNLNSITPRAIERQAGMDPDTPDLPDKLEELLAMDETVYDAAPWDRSADGHRNLLEGWPDGPQLHNRVHVWIGGDMSPGTSPNDPSFFLNHCFVDRAWEMWMIRHGRNYEPGTN